MFRVLVFRVKNMETDCLPIQKLSTPLPNLESEKGFPIPYREPLRGMVSIRVFGECTKRSLNIFVYIVVSNLGDILKTYHIWVPCSLGGGLVRGAFLEPP